MASLFGWWLCVFLAAPSQGSPPTPCSVGGDCSLNGVCVESACVCDPGWVGPACGVLRLVAPSTIIPAYPPPELVNSTSSWGGSILQRAGGGIFDMFVSEFSNSCGQFSWSANSRIVHAQSATAAGPYTRVGVVAPEFAYNPRIIQAPDGTFMLFKLGCGPYGGTPFVPCTDCTGGISGSCPDVPEIASCSFNTTNFLFAASPDGPWTEYNASVIFEPTWTGDSNGGWDNPTAIFDESSGAVLALGRDETFFGDTAANLGVMTAPSWRGPYTCLGPIGQPGAPYVGESFMWRDARGGFHLLAHKYIVATDPTSDRAGAHGWSTDGFTWFINPQDAYPSAVTTADGVVHPYSGHRDRPALVFDQATRLPTHLVTAMGYLDPSNDHTFTFVQQIDLWGNSTAEI